MDPANLMTDNDQEIDWSKINQGSDESINEDDNIFDSILQNQTQDHDCEKKRQRAQEKNTVKKQKKRTRKISKRRKNKNDKTQSKIHSDYKKNICGYITKKGLRQLCNESYKSKVQEFCSQQNAEYRKVIDHYEPKIERITGPSHLPDLFFPSNKQLFPICKVLIAFFKWFFQHRYVRHLINDGKMSKKNIYISYKNRELLPFICDLETKILKCSQNESTYTNQIMDDCLFGEQ